MNGQQVRDRLTESMDERAVSPVIGVILMVAITVILAAVIAAFVMGIGPGGDAVTGGVDISDDGTITVSDSGNSDYVVLVDTSGAIQAYATSNTGAELGTGSSSWSGNEAASLSGKTYNVYLIQSSSSPADDASTSLDDVAGQTKVGEVTYP